MALDEASFWERTKVLYRHPSVELVFDETQQFDTLEPALAWAGST